MTHQVRITFEAKEAGEEGNEFTIDADNTTAFELPVNTDFQAGPERYLMTAAFTIAAGDNDSFNIAVDGTASRITTHYYFSGYL